MRNEHELKGDGPAGGSTGPQRPVRRSPFESPKFWIGAILAVLLLIFIAKNHHEVPVNFVFFTKDAYLIWVMLVCGLIGFIVGWLWGRPHRAESKRRAKDASKKDAKKKG